MCSIFFFKNIFCGAMCVIFFFKNIYCCAICCIFNFENIYCRAMFSFSALLIFNAVLCVCIPCLQDIFCFLMCWYILLQGYLLLCSLLYILFQEIYCCAMSSVFCFENMFTAVRHVVFHASRIFTVFRRDRPQSHTRPTAPPPPPPTMLPFAQFPHIPNSTRKPNFTYYFITLILTCCVVWDAQCCC